MTHNIFEWWMQIKMAKLLKLMKAGKWVEVIFYFYENLRISKNGSFILQETSTFLIKGKLGAINLQNTDITHAGRTEWFANFEVISLSKKVLVRKIYISHFLYSPPDPAHGYAYVICTTSSNCEIRTTSTATAKPICVFDKSE